MNAVIEKLKAKAGLVSTVVCFGVFITIERIINGGWIGVAKLLKMTGGVNILDFENGYTVSRAYEVLNKLGTEGRAFYLGKILPMDFLFPMAYSVFYFAAILYLLKLLKIEKFYLNMLALLPVFALLSDYMENVMLISMLNAFPNRLILQTSLASLLTQSKFLFIYLNIITIAALIVGNIILRIVRSIKNVKGQV